MKESNWIRFVEQSQDGICKDSRSLSLEQLEGML
jgi:hypothetical protein